ncbi:MAG: hypothetical protein RIQ56_114, partial [Candidatus Parcubacteria bacterium]
MASKEFFAATGFIISTTVGAGIFALPAVFYRAGVGIGFAYLIFIAAALGIVHLAYYDVLRQLRERHELLGLVKKYVGAASFMPALFVIIGGLFLSLVAYVVLGEAFLRILFPGLSYPWRVALFWGVASLPMLVGFKRLGMLEFLGALLMAVLVLVVHVTSSAIGEYPADLVLIHPEEALLPLGPLIFAFAGWTAIRPALYSGKQSSLSPRAAKRAITLGTAMAAVIYLAFVVAILGSGESITSDTLSGLAGWGYPMLAMLSFFGLLAIVTSYWPMSIEIRDSLVRDAGFSQQQGILLVLLVPIIFVVAGVRDFLS